jgi:hypothetical protein
VRNKIFFFIFKFFYFFSPKNELKVKILNLSKLLSASTQLKQFFKCKFQPFLIVSSNFNLTSLSLYSSTSLRNGAKPLSITTLSITTLSIAIKNEALSMTTLDTELSCCVGMLSIIYAGFHKWA